MEIKGKQVNEGKAFFALGWGGCVSKAVCHKYPNEKTTFKMSLPSQNEGEPERTCLIPLQLPPIYPFPILPHSTFQYTSVLFCFLPLTSRFHLILISFLSNATFFYLLTKLYLIKWNSLISQLKVSKWLLEWFYRD